jgi:hypothetical protein
LPIATLPISSARSISIDRSTYLHMRTRYEPKNQQVPRDLQHDDASSRQAAFLHNSSKYFEVVSTSKYPFTILSSFSTLHAKTSPKLGRMSLLTTMDKTASSLFSRIQACFLLLAVLSPLGTAAFLPNNSKRQHSPWQRRRHHHLGRSHHHHRRQQQQQLYFRNEKQQHHIATTTSSPPLSSTVIEFVDPTTQAQVVLVGVFHGTSSSAQDVKTVLTTSSSSSSNTNVVVVLELCASRFADLQREQERRSLKEEEGDDKTSRKKKKKSWAERYARMIWCTVQQKGVATGMAAALLSGFSGLQSAMSGFTPGLEFVTALEHQCHGAATEGVSSTDILLADQDVDETLRKLGDLHGSASEVFLWERLEDGQRKRRNLASIWNECQLHATTLQQAIFGSSLHHNAPQVHLPSALLRNKSAVADLVRLALPSMLLISMFSQAIAIITGANDAEIMTRSTASAAAWMEYGDSMSFEAWIGHSIASGMILASGFLASIPVVKTILTERDEILTAGIQEGTLQ